MPIIEITLFEGQTPATKQRLAKAVTDAVAESIPTKPETVSIILREIPPEHFAVGGVLRSRPGS